MKPIHLIVIAVAAAAIYYFVKRGPIATSGGDSVTSSQTGGAQTAVSGDTFNTILSAVNEAFKLGNNIFGTKNAGDGSGIVAQTEVKSFGV